MNAHPLVAEFLAEIKEFCPEHMVYSHGDFVTARSSLDSGRWLSTIYPCTDENKIELHCYDFRLHRRLYLKADIQHPTDTDRFLKLFRDNLDGKLQGHYDGEI